MDDTFLWMQFSYLYPYGVYIYLMFFCRSFDRTIFLVPIYLVIILFFTHCIQSVVWYSVVSNSAGHDIVRSFLDVTNSMVCLPVFSVSINYFVVCSILHILYVGSGICRDILVSCLWYTVHILHSNKYQHIWNSFCLQYTTYIIHRKLYLYMWIILLYQV